MKKLNYYTVERTATVGAPGSYKHQTGTGKSNYFLLREGLALPGSTAIKPQWEETTASNSKINLEQNLFGIHEVDGAW